uniref:cytochrome c oxidase subunit III n=1 Tax=Tapes dorsatus TaxID=368939 RepID=UPI002036868F|nr:cytochrome c oxidase subunit III [Tapes dorsatus]YP_010555901.1 cytochrome c oxidase subunit III [Tapes conspersus]URH16434.1 cytochrome c oxidase subunit III [Tapes dorsatus]UYR95133.1 cytochrome c oxidase subunit III [Tapes conspersus]
MARTGFKLLKWSPWPIYVSMGLLGVVSSFINAIHSEMVFVTLVVAVFSWVFLSGSLFGWWGDMLFEGNYKGYYTSRVKRNLRWGFAMFVTSEVFFFASFFSSWFYFGVGENSQVLLGSWPPEGVVVMYPWKIPALNTVLLLSSGVCVTLCQRCVVAMSKFSQGSPMSSVVTGNSVSSVKDVNFFSSIELSKLRTKGLLAMGLSIGLGAVFMYFQFLEYTWSSVTFSDSTYGGCFYILTGFHGMHVILGVCALSVCWVRIYYNNFVYRRSYVGLDCAILYWHFVDVVWIGLFVSVYLWPYLFLAN